LVVFTLSISSRTRCCPITDTSRGSNLHDIRSTPDNQLQRSQDNLL
jgi:hypothetical protein